MSEDRLQAASNTSSNTSKVSVHLGKIILSFYMFCQTVVVETFNVDMESIPVHVGDQISPLNFVTVSNLKPNTEHDAQHNYYLYYDNN
jgi:hypothetical protein